METEPTPPNPIEALRALAVCLRHLACGYGLMAAERAACLSLLQTHIAGVSAAKSLAAQKILASSRRLSSRERSRASELSTRFTEMSEHRGE